MNGKKYMGVTFFLALLMIFAMSVAAGCGEDEDTDTDTAATETNGETATATAAEAPDEVITTVVTEPCPETPAAGCTAVEFVSLSIDNTTYTIGDTITFTAEIKGDAKNVSVIYGKSGGDVASPHDISAMVPKGTSGGITTWQGWGIATEGFMDGSSFYTGFAISQDNVQTMSPTQGSYTVTGP